MLLEFVPLPDATFSNSTLAPANITLNPTGTATANVGVSGSSNTRTVTLSSLTGDGNLGISVASGTGSDMAGNTAPAAGDRKSTRLDSRHPVISHCVLCLYKTHRHITVAY